MLHESHDRRAHKQLHEVSKRDSIRLITIPRMRDYDLKVVSKESERGLPAPANEGLWSLSAALPRPVPQRRTQNW